VYVDHEASPERLQESDDSRGFLENVVPIKRDDFAAEVLKGTPPSTAQIVQPRSFEALLTLLYSVHALSGKAIRHRFTELPILHSFSDSTECQEQIDRQKRLNPFWDSSKWEESVKIRDFIDGKTVLSLYEELDYNINLRLANQNSLPPNPDEAVAVIFQQREMMRYKGTLKGGIGFEVSGGSRLLFLDGGGIKGLVQLEVLRQLEAATGRKITELFDWIIGASIGGVIALGLVYGKCVCVWGGGGCQVDQRLRLLDCPSIQLRCNTDWGTGCPTQPVAVEPL
jgi:hypothetical protein